MNKAPTPRYRLQSDGTFVLQHYHAAPPFASFLPGIAGPWGRPLWVFYVNRGQGIACFGLRDKEHAMVEFQPAAQAYRLTSSHGFRTFLKVRAGRRTVCYEPFQATSPRADQRLHVTAEALMLHERSHTVGLDCGVRYFTLPNEPMAALVRVLTVTNHARRSLMCDVLDGLATVVPYGSTDRFLKHMGRTLQAWFTVNNLPYAPVFRLVSEPHDRPEVIPITEGNFYAAWMQRDARLTRLPAIVEPERVFGTISDLSAPAAFWAAQRLQIPKAQYAANRTPVAMAHGTARLAPGQSVNVVSVMGHTRNEANVNAYLTRVTPTFLANKEAENRDIVRALQDRAFTATGSRVFDMYVRQTFLDNLLRGGFPQRVGTDDRSLVYLYGRKHGDLERDYNRFVLEPAPWSQGNANYRDLNQNRRNDGWIEPRAVELNLKLFMDLIQLDGFNPLVCTGTRFRIADAADVLSQVRARIPRAHLAAFTAQLTRPWTPGELVLWMVEHGVTDRAVQAQVVATVVAVAERLDTAEHGEGFWSDHWHYTFDLLDSLTQLYPERLQQWLVERSEFTYYDNTHVVAPRQRKYVRQHGVIRQTHAVHIDPEKVALISARTQDPMVARTDYGCGVIFRTTLCVKLWGLLANKVASLDPGGVGIEMESGKPNWHDALNGLPALFGSAVSETFEVARGVRWLRHALEQVTARDTEPLSCPQELVMFCRSLRTVLTTFRQSPDGDERDVAYWSAATTAKEIYREAVRLGVSGELVDVPLREVHEWLTLALSRLESALPRAYDAHAGMYRTYFWYEPMVYEKLSPVNDSQAPVPVSIRQFRRHDLPFFLEGNVHALRYEADAAKRAALHRAVTRSALFDKPLKMYKVTASLKHAPEEIGRARIFERGWLEHESVWLHMEYKYLLELLRGGLTEQFFAAWDTAGIPQQPLKRYGRSTLESSSFLVSSAYPDARLHGQGFVARLSGATAEFMHIWRLLFVGDAGFSVAGNGQLAFTFAPQLSSTLFTTKVTKTRFTRRDGTCERVTLPKHSASILLFGQTLVTYVNPTRRPTFGPRRVKPVRIAVSNGRPMDIAGDTLPTPYAAQFRDGQFRQLHIHLA